MEEEHEAEDCAAKWKSTKAAPPTAADFLKTTQARARLERLKRGVGRARRLVNSKHLQQAKAANSSKDTTPAVPSPPAEEDFKEVCSKAASRRARKLASAALHVDSAVVGTVLFKPSAQGALSRAPPADPGPGILLTTGCCCHTRQPSTQIVAADVTTRECLEQLLALTELRGIAVKARQPADRLTSIGYLHGVDGEPDNASSYVDCSLAAGAVGYRRGQHGHTTIRRTGPSTAREAVPGPVPRATSKTPPLQCRQCGRFGHAREACSRPDGCIRCGRAHPEGETCQRPRCINCGGPHAADTPACPRWQQECKPFQGERSEQWFGRRSAKTQPPGRWYVPMPTWHGGPLDLLLPVALDWPPNVCNLLTTGPAEEPCDSCYCPWSGSRYHGPTFKHYRGRPACSDAYGTWTCCHHSGPEPADSLAEILLQAMKFACAAFPEGHLLRAIYQQAVAGQPSSTQHG
ncbi:hypothetical protein HPB52_012238 [Rhipicephalus sanguineus]|uniref:CCHC-type domain-containing protein n=1 Tax=Rhipicephalus sanguineus TaxID=34632 RepID=A0A9D4PZP4_RHISA|nr:hypothetical protein HPB52_012238 [Rhipicephalus sanguineus]